MTDQFLMQQWFNARPANVQERIKTHPLGEYALDDEKTYVIGYPEFNDGSVGVYVAPSFQHPDALPKDAVKTICGSCLKQLILVKPYLVVQ